MKLYIYNLLISIDQLINTIFGGAPDQTISSRLWKHRDNRVAYMLVIIVDLIFHWHEQEHCRKSFESGDRQIFEVWG